MNLAVSSLAATAKRDTRVVIWSYSLLTLWNLLEVQGPWRRVRPAL